MLIFFAIVIIFMNLKSLMNVFLNKLCFFKKLFYTIMVYTVGGICRSLYVQGIMLYGSGCGAAPWC